VLDNDMQVAISNEEACYSMIMAKNTLTMFYGWCTL